VFPAPSSKSPARPHLRHPDRRPTLPRRPDRREAPRPQVERPPRPAAPVPMPVRSCTVLTEVHPRASGRRL